ncbi:MAG: TRAP transporter fused permease subunit [Pseudomonadota bacterium]
MSQVPSERDPADASSDALKVAGKDVDPDRISYFPTSRPVTVGLFVAAVAVALWHIWANSIGIVPDLTRNVIHFAAFGVFCTFAFPLVKANTEWRDTGRWIDLTIAAVLVACCAYILIRERALSGRDFTNVLDFVVCIAVIVIGIELTRRTTGWIIPAIIVVALGYILWWGSLIPGAMGFPGLSLETVLQRSIYGEDGMFGLIASISSTFVVMFILFGAFLTKSGANEFIIQFARAIAGRIIGGPGFVAVVASGLNGTISGSAVANTVSTGVITIPLMKRSGFPSRVAAGVEASASTGGQLMPPIMGAGAFVMASFTEIPYLDIIALAFLPALMFFAGIAFNVRIIAKKEGLQPSETEGLSAWKAVKERGVTFIIPLCVLVAALIVGYTPTYAAGAAIIAVIASSWLTKSRMGIREILDALVLGVRNMILTAILLVTVGLIVMVITTTGIGNTFSLLIASWADGSLIIAIILIAIASLVLGMGLPVTAAYIVLATLSAPALEQLISQSQVIEALAGQPAPQSVSTIFLLFTPDLLVQLAGQWGVPLTADAATGLVGTVTSGDPLTQAQAATIMELSRIPDIAPMIDGIGDTVLSATAITTALLSAHMIIFWLSQDSNVTPPVCLTAFAAAAIAKSQPMKTGFTAWKISKTLYIVPLLFAYTQLLGDNFLAAFEIFAFGLLGIYALIVALEGHAEAAVAWYLRPVIAAIGVALLWPNSILVHVLGAALLIVFLAINIRIDRRQLAAKGATG